MSDIESRGATNAVSAEAPPSAGLPSSRSEKRAGERNVVAYFGVVTAPGHDPAQVDLVDLSALGARMVVKPGFKTPEPFELKVPETGARFNCEIAWRTDNTIGVKFVHRQN